MIISKNYAKALVKLGKAVELGTVVHDGREYMAINRHDLNRVDHVKITKK